MEPTKMAKSIIPNAVTRKAARIGLKLKQHAPEILIGVGVISIVGVAATAIRATLKVESVVDGHAEDVEAIKSSDADDTTKQRAIAKRYVETSGEFFMLYIPTLTFGVLAVSCFLGGHKIMKQRNAALAAAYKIVEYSYDQYRAKVREDHGEEYDSGIVANVASSELASRQFQLQTLEDGAVVAAGTITDPNSISVYARFFDESNIAWEPSAEHNLMFLRMQQSYWNDKLRVRGHVFLNEVYESLGFEHSSAGAICGWVLGDSGDDYIDFGIYDKNSDTKRAFVNGDERAILLDFNVEGPIYNKI